MTLVESLGLTPLLKQTLLDTLCGRRSYAEVAAEQGVSVETIRSRNQRARALARSKGVTIPRRLGHYTERCVSDRHPH